jgi:hypothetical protein
MIQQIQHILDTLHTYGTMEDTMDILHVEKKGALMNTLKRFHICNLSKENLHMNDTYTDTYNPFFNVIKDYHSQKLR